MLVLIKSKNQEAPISKETLNKAPMVQAHWGLWIRALHVQTSWSMEAPPAPEHPNQPWVTQNKQTTVATGELPQHLRTPLGKLTQSARSHPSEAVCAWALAKAGRERMECFGAILLAKCARKWNSITLTSALLYNRHEHDRRDEKESKTTTSTADHHLLIEITN